MDQTSRTKLMTVEDSFLITGRGVVLLPKIPVGAYSGPRSRTITLRKPEGHERTATDSLDIPRVNPMPSDFYYLCLIADVAKDDIPIGTEIKIDEHAA